MWLRKSLSSTKIILKITLKRCSIPKQKSFCKENHDFNMLRNYQIHFKAITKY